MTETETDSGSAEIKTIRLHFKDAQTNFTSPNVQQESGDVFYFISHTHNVMINNVFSGVIILLKHYNSTVKKNLNKQTDLRGQTHRCFTQFTCGGPCHLSSLSQRSGPYCPLRTVCLFSVVSLCFRFINIVNININITWTWSKHATAAQVNMKTLCAPERIITHPGEAVIGIKM